MVIFVHYSVQFHLSSLAMKLPPRGLDLDTATVALR